MKFFLWTSAYLVALFLDMVCFSRLFGSAAPTISFGVFLLAAASQRFWPGLGFAGCAGVARDIVAAHQDATHAIFFLATFLVIQGVEVVSSWDEPMQRIAGVVAGVVAIPLTWSMAEGLGQMVFHHTPHLLVWSDIASVPGVSEAVFTIVWVSLFAWFSLRWFRSRRSSALERLI